MTEELHLETSARRTPSVVPSLDSSSAAGERCVDIASHRTRRRVSQCSLSTVPRLLRVTLLVNILTAPLTGGDQSSQGNIYGIYVVWGGEAGENEAYQPGVFLRMHCS